MPTVTLDPVRIANARTSGVDINEVGLIDDYAAAFIDLARDGPGDRRADDPPRTPIRNAETSAPTTLPRGFEYWERLAAIIEHEPIDDRDGAFHAMLKPLGLEKGTPFTPDARQRAILTDAAEIGFLMAQALPWDQGPVSPSLS
ncbi:MAG: hypothetical protein FJZ38_20470 [Candidatus Rokubacteria bacterium]|nr:hypothetical protein [Candidatus Rokubacteria bacterium]